MNISPGWKRLRHNLKIDGLETKETKRFFLCNYKKTALLVLEVGFISNKY